MEGLLEYSLVDSMEGSDCSEITLKIREKLWFDHWLMQRTFSTQGAEQGKRKLIAARLPLWAEKRSWLNQCSSLICIILWFLQSVSNSKPHLQLQLKILNLVISCCREKNLSSAICISLNHILKSIIDCVPLELKSVIPRITHPPFELLHSVIFWVLIQQSQFP